MELRKKVLLIVMVPLISSQSAYTFPFVTVLEHFCLNWQEVNINLILNVEQGQEDALLQAFHQEFKNCNGRTMGFIDSRNKGHGSSMDLKSLEDFEKTITFFIEDGATSQHIPDTDLNRGIWIIPQEYVQELDPYKLRLDSQIYYFSTVGLDTFEISEIYSIKGQKSVKRVTEMLSMSQATPGGHLHPSNQELFWERRSNLSGITLQGRSKTYRQYSKLKMFNKTHVESTSGMFLDIMDIMQEKMGFEIVYQVPADGQWGALNVSS